jgi:carboxylesterase
VWSAEKRFAGALRGAGLVNPVNVPGREPGLLAIHGFGCVPEEVELLSSLGVELGLATRAPLLPGHGVSVAEFAKTRYADWYASVERHFLEMSEHTPALVGRQSMGAVLSLDLASRYPQRCAGLILFANAVRLASPFPSVALRAASWLRVPDFALPKTKGPDLNDPIAKATHTTYAAQPFHAARSLQVAGERVLERLTRVRCPTFIGHGALDHTAPPSNAWLVADHLGTTDVEVHLFANSAHILTKDLDRETLRAQVRAFLKRVLSNYPAGSNAG